MSNHHHKQTWDANEKLRFQMMSCGPAAKLRKGCDWLMTGGKQSEQQSEDVT